MNFVFFAMASPDPNAQTSPLAMFVPLLGMLALFYFLLIRPQQKRQRELQKMIDGLRKGDRVVTASGIYGTVHGMHDDIVVLRIADNVKVEMSKSAITGVVEKGSD